MPRLDTTFRMTPRGSVGKLCETVLRFLQQELTASYTSFGTHISNFADECQKLIGLLRGSGSESLRVIIPRALIFLYTLRGKRGIGHVGGDIEANQIDLETMVRIADWVICELIRIYHKFSLEEAQALVDSISSRNLPLVWEVGGKKRVLISGLDYKQQVMVLLYATPDSGVLSEDLFAWTEHSNQTVFKRSVLTVLHKARLIEYDGKEETVVISPLGAIEAEAALLRKEQGAKKKS